MSNGVNISIGRLIKMNNDWKGAKNKVDVPAPRPKIVNKTLPAQVGQPMNSPANALEVEISEIFFVFLNLSNLIECKFNATFTPTNNESKTARIIFKGINKIEKFSVNRKVAIGK